MKCPSINNLVLGERDIHRTRNRDRSISNLWKIDLSRISVCPSAAEGGWEMMIH